MVRRDLSPYIPPASHPPLWSGGFLEIASHSGSYTYIRFWFFLFCFCFLIAGVLELFELAAKENATFSAPETLCLWQLTGV